MLARQAERGTRLLGAAEGLLQAVGAQLESDDRIPYEHAVEYAHSQLEKGEFERAWGEGKAMSVEEAIGYALED